MRFPGPASILMLAVVLWLGNEAPAGAGETRGKADAAVVKVDHIEVRGSLVGPAPTYYADLTVILRGATKVFDSRSSDAIALAVHFGAPVFVSRETLDQAGTVIDEPQPSKPGEVRL